MSAIENLYTSILGRPSDTSGKQYWDAELARRTGAGENRDAVLANIADSFRASSEYRENNPSTSPSTNTGGGSSNTGGGSSNTSSGGGGAPAPGPGVAGGSGYSAADIGAHLDSLYTGFFNRPADQAGKDYWLRAIQEGHHGNRNPYEWLTASFQESPEYANRNFGGDGTTTPPGLTQEDLNNAIAGIQFPEQQQDQGMGDFMKFMMLMSMMRGGGMGGFGGMGGYGGSQYGYGGLHPGGVMQSQDPLALLQGMGSWFRDNFGSGAGTSTGTVNTGSGATGGNSGN